MSSFALDSLYSLRVKVKESCVTFSRSCIFICMFLHYQDQFPFRKFIIYFHPSFRPHFSTNSFAKFALPDLLSLFARRIRHRVVERLTLDGKRGGVEW